MGGGPVVLGRWSAGLGADEAGRGIMLVAVRRWSAGLGAKGGNGAVVLLLLLVGRWCTGLVKVEG